MPAKGYRTMGEELENVAMRLPLSVLVDVDAHIDTLRKTAPWAKVGRSDALRDLVVRGLHSVQEPPIARQSPIPPPQHEVPHASVPDTPPPRLQPDLPGTGQPGSVPRPAILPIPEEHPPLVPRDVQPEGSPATPAPTVPTGMKQCGKQHPPFPMGKRECPTCSTERKRAERQRKAQQGARVGAEP